MAIVLNKPVKFFKAYVVMWSKSQDCFHSDTIEDMLFQNLDVFYGKNPNASDWIVVGFANTYDEGRALMLSMKKKKVYFKKHGRLPVAQ